MKNLVFKAMNHKPLHKLKRPSQQAFHQLCKQDATYRLLNEAGV